MTLFRDMNDIAEPFQLEYILKNPIFDFLLFTSFCMLYLNPLRLLNANPDRNPVIHHVTDKTSRLNIPLPFRFLKYFLPALKPRFKLLSS